MTNTLVRIVLGFVAAVVAVLTFHQGTIWVMSQLGLLKASVYSMSPVPPYGVPRIASLCFWGGLYGAVYGLIWPRLTVPAWFSGVCLGLIAAFVGMIVVAGIKGQPIMYGGASWPIARSLIINGMFGLGTGLFFPVLLSLCLPGGRRGMARP